MARFFFCWLMQVIAWFPTKISSGAREGLTHTCEYFRLGRNETKAKVPFQSSRFRRRKVELESSLSLGRRVGRGGLLFGGRGNLILYVTFKLLLSVNLLDTDICQTLGEINVSALLC